MKPLYDKTLANQWIEWVEKPDPEGAREHEILPYIKRWLDTNSPKTIADIGCGQGSCSGLIGKKTQYVGIDPSKTLLERARKLYTSPNKRFIEGDAYKIPLTKSSVDAVMSIWVWSHLADLESAAAEMHRILKPKGKLLIVTANPETYDERKTFYKRYKINGNLLVGDFDLGNGKVLANTTLYLHTKEHIEDSIRNSSLKISAVNRLGKAETSDLGLYLAIEGYK